MAKQHFTQVDADVLEGWLIDLFEIARATQFVLDIGNQLTTVGELRSMTATLRIISSSLVDCVEHGHKRYII